MESEALKALQARLGDVPPTLSEPQTGQLGRVALGSTAADRDLHIRQAQKLARSGERPVAFDDLAAVLGHRTHRLLVA